MVRIEYVGGALMLMMVVLLGGWGTDEVKAATGDECGEDLQKVTTCLSFATGKAVAPSKDCCDAVSDIKESKPKCLCLIILEIHNGSNPELKGMGIQESRLLQLPSACKLANASISECPKLLQIPPSAPDYAIFNNSATPSAPTGGASPSSTETSSSPAKADDSNGLKIGPHVLGSMASVVAVLFYAFPAGLMLL